MKKTVNILAGLILIFTMFLNVNSITTFNVDTKLESLAFLNNASANPEDPEEPCDEQTGYYLNYIDVFGSMCSDPEGNVCGMESYCTFKMHADCSPHMCVVFV